MTVKGLFWELEKDDESVQQADKPAKDFSSHYWRSYSIEEEVNIESLPIELQAR